MIWNHVARARTRKLIPWGRVRRYPRRWLPRRTIRVRLTLLLWTLFVASALVLLAVTVALWQQRTTGHIQVSAVPEPATHATRGLVTSQQHTDLHELLVVSAIGLGIMIAFSLLLGWLVAGRLLAPLRTITSTARRISATSLHERLNLVGPDDELKELGDTLDALLARLERSFAFERQFVANASHELRTPLAGMRTSLDVAMAKPGPVPRQFQTLAERLRRELEQAERLLASFLTLAHSQQGPIGERATVSLANLAQAAIERHADDLSARGLHVDAEAQADAWVSGSETLLSRMADNVIENAINHNHSGGWIRTTTAADAQHVCLVVENGGPVLDPAEVTELALPFRRVGAQRTGSDKGAGLGLAIVESIAEAHGGTLALEARSERRPPRRNHADPGRSPRRRSGAQMRVLVVDDSRTLADALAEGLHDEGMAVDIAYDGVEAATKLDLNPYDVVVLDRDLPGCTATHSAPRSQTATTRQWCSCSPPLARPASASPASASAPTTTSPNRSTSPSSCSGSGRSRAGNPPPEAECSAQPASSSTHSGTPLPARAGGSTSQPRSSQSWKPSCELTTQSSAQKICSRRYGRTHRPVHQHSPRHDQPPPTQTRRPPCHPDDSQRRVPDRDSSVAGRLDALALTTSKAEVSRARATHAPTFESTHG